MVVLLLALVLILIIIVFAIQNADLMLVKFLSWQFSMPKAVLLFIALLAGAILGAIWHAIRYVSFSRVLKEFNRKLKENEEKLQAKDEELEKLRQTKME